jgi:lipoic acid synthetase
MQALMIEDCGLVEYRQAQQRQLELVALLHREPQEPDHGLILEHPPVFTLGRNGSAAHLVVDEAFLAQQHIELLRVERGGEVTYHGPGQLVCYPIINLRRLGLSVVDYVELLETVMLDVTASFGLNAARDRRNHGIWVAGRKLGSIGIAIRHSISFHGLALNVNLDLKPYSWINPCGLSEVSMTSMVRESKRSISIDEVKQVLSDTLRHRVQQAAESAQPGASGTREHGQKKQTPRQDTNTARTEKKSTVRMTPKPRWLKKRLPVGAGYERTRRLVGDSNLHTVCREARCPNQFECYTKGTATFMIMGERCTRNCRFCAVAHGALQPLDPDEPARIAVAVAEMGLDYAVLTSVTRDDLADGGAAHFLRTIEAIRSRCPSTLVEVLIPDLQGNPDALELICSGRPAVINHNIETVPSLYPQVRPQAIYRRSLELLERVKRFDPGLTAKSGLMVGLGEGRDELVQTMRDIRAAGCEILTLGQYLQPTPEHLAVKRFVEPEVFAELKIIAQDLGFGAVASGPHVRSSYRAGHLYRSLVPPVSA